MENAKLEARPDLIEENSNLYNQLEELRQQVQVTSLSVLKYLTLNMSILSRYPHLCVRRTFL